MAFTLDELETPTRKKARQEELYSMADVQTNYTSYDILNVPCFGRRNVRGIVI